MRGINKMIVEINNTDNKYFEKAILFLKPDLLNVNTSCAELSEGAEALINDAANTPSLTKQIKLYTPGKMKKRHLPSVLLIILSSLAGSIITACIMIASHII